MPLLVRSDAERIDRVPGRHGGNVSAYGNATEATPPPGAATLGDDPGKLPEAAQEAAAQVTKPACRTAIFTTDNCSTCKTSWVSEPNAGGRSLHWAPARPKRAATDHLRADLLPRAAHLDRELCQHDARQSAAGKFRIYRALT